ncbi:carbohydrate phosphatase [Stipitochalara longipes BDJ]|nr:carbohydrate phosphatase [Stipitochalara longipes BDJ]
MTSAPYFQERLIAELAVQRAAILTKKVLSSVNRGEFEKTDATPVTIADFAAQALLISAIRGAFPSDRFVGEENADALRDNASLRQRVWDLVASTHLDDSKLRLDSPASVEDMLEIIDLGGRGTGGPEGRIWMLDPIDGTATFLRGEQYAISLALIEDGKEKVGVLGCPNLSLQNGKVQETVVDERGYGLMLSAIIGQGATIRPIGTGSLRPATRIERLGEGPIDLKDLHFVDSSQSNTWWHEKVGEVAGRVDAAYPGTEVWSSHMRYVALIVGGADVQLRIPRSLTTHIYVWDHAGIQLIFTEVGGKITDLNGKDIDFGTGRELANNWGIIAAKHGVHSRILTVVNEMLHENS